MSQRFAIPLLCCLLVQTGGNHPIHAVEQQDSRISRLIQNLGGDSFLEREQAQRQLLQIGGPAIAEKPRTKGNP